MGILGVFFIFFSFFYNEHYICNKGKTKQISLGVRDATSERTFGSAIKLSLFYQKQGAKLCK